MMATRQWVSGACRDPSWPVVTSRRPLCLWHPTTSRSRVSPC